MTFWHTVSFCHTRTTGSNSHTVRLWTTSTPDTPQVITKPEKTAPYPAGGLWQRWLRVPPVVLNCIHFYILNVHTHTK